MVMFMYMVEVAPRTAIGQWGIAAEPDSKPFARSVVIELRVRATQSVLSRRNLTNIRRH
jgi:hypothetical protein